MDRAVTRDLNWGIPIPMEGYDDKRIYVWVEAVWGYVSATQRYCEENGLDWRDFWFDQGEGRNKMYMCHGKDNIVFHTIIFPALLLATDKRFHLPDHCVSIEFLNAKGEKMSKSKGNIIYADDLTKLIGVDLKDDGIDTEKLEEVLKTMYAAIDAGLKRDGVLPGGMRLQRRARSIYQKSRFLQPEVRRTGLVAAYATAVSEENAALGTVVTAPTCGSAGVLPGVLRYLSETLGSDVREQVHALETAGLVGNVVKRNGSISGAEVGCQGEVGVACAMAAAAAAYLYGGTAPQCETAAEIGLEHFLGLTCDPVKGLVQIPCIERNAIAANRALVAAEMAILSDGRHRVSFDEVVATMLRTGHDLPSLYRETAEGGLAAHVKD